MTKDEGKKPWKRLFPPKHILAHRRQRWARKTSDRR